jgi:uncharacterized RDD family membrane protein YckC
MADSAPLRAAGLGRRLASLVYEGMLVLAVLFAAAFAFQVTASGPPGPLEGWTRHIFQGYLFLVAGFYFVWPWARGGQTLPMKTWKLRLVRADGAPLGPRRALARYALSWLSVLSIGAGFAWAVFDRDRQFLHDRLAGTRIVSA